MTHPFSSVLDYLERQFHLLVSLSSRNEVYIDLMKENIKSSQILLRHVGEDLHDEEMIKDSEDYNRLIQCIDEMYPQRMVKVNKNKKD